MHSIGLHHHAIHGCGYPGQPQDDLAQGSKAWNISYGAKEIMYIPVDKTLRRQEDLQEQHACKPIGSQNDVLAAKLHKYTR